VNRQRELDALVAGFTTRPKLLLHVCCAPCASYCIEYLAKFFDITLYWYNPNIQPPEEREKRLAELRRFLSLTSELPLIIDADDAKLEPGNCRACIAERLNKTAQQANKMNFDYYCTTLTVSPHKNAELINELGELSIITCNLSIVKWLLSDFKKRNGYLRTIELSREYGLYRQNYCGCLFS
jgi:predicted adenine nucleotide alpha hydrolase (AANH) superfamily ATPase